MRRMRPLCMSLSLLLGLVACQREQAVPPPSPLPQQAQQARQQQAQHTAVTPVAAAAENPLVAIGQARSDGYGDLRFGMTAAAAEQAWGGAMNGKPGPGETCYYLTPKWAKSPREFGFMIADGRFVRYDVGNDKEVAPGGGKRGMDAAAIRVLYAGRVTETPNKYVEGASELRVAGNDGGVLVFETGADRRVTAWRVGQAPQVDFSEGCS